MRYATSEEITAWLKAEDGFAEWQEVLAGKAGIGLNHSAFVDRNHQGQDCLKFLCSDLIDLGIEAPQSVEVLMNGENITIPIVHVQGRINGLEKTSGRDI